MNSASKHAVTALLVFSIAGCAPKNTKTAPPAQAQAPATTPATPAGKAGAMYPPPLTESQTQTQPTTPPPAPVVAQTQPEPTPPPTPPPSPKKTSHKAKPSAAKPAGTENGSTQTGVSETPASSGSGAATADTTDVAANSEPAAASPIGELAPADTPQQAQKGKDTGDLIAKTEDGLNSIKRTLTTQEQETANQIRAFLTKARTALANQDFDAAFILATKAKVLLDELNKT
jgi:outer membrane biosynthesis protein TonB